MTTPRPTVGDVASLVRSKNAGPFWLTLDIFCDSEDSYRAVAAEGVVTPEHVGRLYQVDPEQVSVYQLPDLQVVKVSFPRPVPQAAAADRDLHGGQQHIPLAYMAIRPGTD